MFWQDFYDATMYTWLLAGITLMLGLKVFLPGPLRTAPPRHSSLSLPVVGGVLLVYLIIGVAASLLAVVTHLLPMQTLNDAPATAPVAKALATISANATAPSTAATEDNAASAPASATAAPKDYTVMEQAVGGSAELLVVGLFVLFAPFFFREGYRGWGLSSSQIPSGLLAGLVGFLMVFPALIISAELSEWFINNFLHRDMEIHPTFQALHQNPPLADKISLFVLAAIVAPVAEEIFFRGILQTTLIQFGWGFLVPQLNPHLKPLPDRRPPPYQRWAAIGIVSIAFAAVHPPDHRLVIFLLSVSLGYVYERTGNLWAAMTLHGLFNSVAILMNP